MRYISDLNISFSLPVDGVDKRFCFTPCAKGGSMYITNRPKEIEALEKSDMFGRVYRRLEMPSVQEGTKERSKKRGGRTQKSNPLTELKGIDTWQEAIEYLVEKCGSDREKLTTPDEILSEAAAKGIRFPNINNT